MLNTPIRFASTVFAILCTHPTVLPAQPAGGAITLAPHRAVYDITLEKAAPGSGVSELSGRMVYELNRTKCNAYVQNMRFVTQVTDAKGNKKFTDLRTSNWEPDEGQSLEFESSHYHGDALEEATQGRARREGVTAPVTVKLTRPRNKRIELGSGIYFPMQHSRALIAAARSGRNNFYARLYDGSEKGEKAYQTNAFIGRRLPAGAIELPAELRTRAGLSNRVAWPVSISYFEPDGGTRDEAPTYELSYRYYDNGVSTRLRIDYGDFVILGHLSAIDLLDVIDCKTTANGTDE